MEDRQRKELQNQFRNLINKNIETIIRSALFGYYTSSSSQFKKKVSLQELVNYKLDASGKDDNTKFQKFITICDDIIISIKIMFPCVNIEGLDLSWTTEEIQSHVWKMLDATKEVTLEDVPRIPLEEQEKKKKEISAEQKALEKRLEAFLREVFGFPPKGGKFRRVRIKTYVDECTDADKKRCYNDLLKEKYNHQTEKYESGFISLFKEKFPEIANLKGLYLSSYSRFNDMMYYLKRVYLTKEVE